jgi:AcrR family transcriptional regulator
MGKRPLVNPKGVRVPTGTAIRDPREQLFEAAERVLLRDGPSALTSRAVTTEAGVAKGVLHHHFADFDAFLVDLVLDSVDRIRIQAIALDESAGTGTVVGHLTEALVNVFDAIGVAIVGLIIARDELRARLRPGRRTGIPVLSEATAMIAAYLAVERDQGRVAADADIDTLAPTLIGAGHLLFADRGAARPRPEAVRRMVSTIMAAALPL